MSLDTDQQSAVDSPARTLRVLAGAGSGKTRVLTQRIARRIEDHSLDPAHALVLTFTRKAADELRTRLQRQFEDQPLPIVTGTFHAVAYAQLRRRWTDLGKTPPTVVGQPLRVMSDVMEDLRMNRLANPRAILSEIAWAKSRSLVPATYIDGVRLHDRRPPVSSRQMLQLYSAYEKEKHRRGLVDYDDLLLHVLQHLRNDANFAASQSWLFRHFFVDEFQDLNAAQFELLRAWLGNGDDLFVVGDPNQAIYGWNGADASYLDTLERHFPRVETIKLGTNYRSSLNVLSIARAIIDDETKPAPDSDLGSVPQVRTFSDEFAEADGIAHAVRDAHHRSYPWRQMAVLVRTNQQRTAIEEAMKLLGIPVRSATGTAWLYDDATRPALEHLRRSPATLLTQRISDVDEMIDEAPAARHSLQQLRTAMQTCLVADENATVKDFLAWLEVSSRQDGPAAEAQAHGAVTITTFHRAKGLEWDVVFLAGIEDGLVPITNADLDEERRLFYVAVTRARKELHCSWARQRLNGAATQMRNQSPWLRFVRSASRPVTLTEATVRMSIASGRQVLHLDRHDDPARTALERWRNARARLGSVEPHLVLDDRALDKIVMLAPQCKEDLAQIEGFGPMRIAAIGDELIEVLHRSDVSN